MREEDGGTSNSIQRGRSPLTQAPPWRTNGPGFPQSPRESAFPLDPSQELYCTSASQNSSPLVSGAIGGGILELNLAAKVVLTGNL